METSEQSTHLVVVIDVLPTTALLLDDGTLYEKWLNAIIAFCNSHLLLNANNKLTVIATGCEHNTIIYPVDREENGNETIPGQYPLFSTVTRVICSQIKQLVSKARYSLEKAERAEDIPQSLMAGAIGIGLLKINRLKSEVDSSRVAIVTACNDNSTLFNSQYMNFMNVFFTAQKMNVVVDACIAVSNNNYEQDINLSILQQGCDLTNGLYLKISNVSAFLEYLLWTLLPDAETRKKLLLPTQKKISYKAACFCHRNLIDIGYVCSVCLSIFCTFSPICSTCHTIFKLGPLPSGMKLKRKVQKLK